MTYVFSGTLNLAQSINPYPPQLWKLVTLNDLELAVILRYFTEFNSFGG